MAKYTTTLMEIIQSQAPTSDLYTTVNGYKQLIYGSTNWKSSIISKIALYDSDIQFIVNDYLFMGLELDDPTFDYIFKKQWVNEFINREIKWQTVNLFRNKLVAQFLKDELTINEIYKNLAYFISGYETVSGTNQGSTITTGTDNSHTTLDTNTNERGASATLPQSSVNLDVANTVLQYADSNTIGASSVAQNGTADKTHNSNTQNNSTLGNNTSRYKIQNALETLEVLRNMMNHYDKTLFLQCW